MRVWLAELGGGLVISNSVDPTRNSANVTVFRDRSRKQNQMRFTLPPKENPELCQVYIPVPLNDHGSTFGIDNLDN